MKMMIESKRMKLTVITTSKMRLKKKKKKEKEKEKEKIQKTIFQKVTTVI